MGGFRVVYEYANRLVARNHEVTVLHPSRVKYPPKEKLSLLRRAKRVVRAGIELYSRPSVRWQKLDSRVKMRFARDSDSRHIPDGDAIFATAWHTVRSVLECPPQKGKKFYLIQGYETWQADKEQIEATWREPLHKIVISKWLLEIASGLGCADVSYIPNAIDPLRYHLTKPMEVRGMQVGMLFSLSEVKGSADGIQALSITKKCFPELKAVLFGTPRRPEWIPAWMEYHQNPPQDFIVNEIYNGSRIFLSSSWAEGFALPPAEAAACGAAIVATDSGGIRDFVENGITGLLSVPRNPSALAENLCRLLNDEPLRLQLAKACNERVAQFSWEKNTDKLCALLQNEAHSKSRSMSQAEPQQSLGII